MSTVAARVTSLGGVATWGQLRRGHSWRAIASALEEESIVRTARGRYALLTAEEARLAASRLSGVCSHLSAAAHWGWTVKTPATEPHVTVRANRKITAARRDGVTVHWRTLSSGDVDGWVTTPIRTVIDCCLDLPLDEAVAVFDSAWRGGLQCREVQLAALQLAPRARRRVLAVAEAADPRAANPFESVLRVIARGVPGLCVETQVRIKDGRFFARVDLADEDLRIVLEADSFEFHGKRAALERDCRRYDELVVRDWLVLRFSWEQVMFDPDWVAEMIRAAVSHRRRQRSLRHRTRPGPEAVSGMSG